MDCYIKLTRDITKDGEEEKTQKLSEYERTGDEKVLKKLTTIKHIFVIEQNIDKSTTP